MILRVGPGAAAEPAGVPGNSCPVASPQGVVEDNGAVRATFQTIRKVLTGAGYTGDNPDLVRIEKSVLKVSRFEG